MPEYSFVCNKCEHEFSEILSIKDRDNKVKCPKCSSKKTKRVISAAYVQFIGSDWQTNSVRGI
jgi:putative FmdB family regulatory protein